MQQAGIRSERCRIQDELIRLRGEITKTKALIGQQEREMKTLQNDYCKDHPNATINDEKCPDCWAPIFSKSFGRNIKT